MTEFTKMQGIGNDYIYVNCFKEKINNPEAVSKFVSDRHFGIGSDGLVLIMPSDVADFRMRIFNADGSEAKMCGNATRCIGKYVFDNGLTSKTKLTLETNSGIKKLQLYEDGGKVTKVSVDMGKAILEPEKIPVKTNGDRFISVPCKVCSKMWEITAVSMGNPHAVTYVDDPMSLDLDKIGPVFENLDIFPDRVNTEFIKADTRTHLIMRVWERGSGETMACGTGACASVVSSVLNGYCDYDTAVTVSLLGGDLEIVYKENGTVIMTGPCESVFSGEIDLKNIDIAEEN